MLIKSRGIRPDRQSHNVDIGIFESIDSSDKVSLSFFIKKFKFLASLIPESSMLESKQDLEGSGISFQQMKAKTDSNSGISF